jgi:halocyanin-like protein
MNRREFLRTAGGAAGTATAVTAATGPAAAQESGGKKGGSGGGSASGPIDYGGYLEGANWSGSTADKTGKKEVTIKVGAGSSGHAFKPAAVHVSPGTKVTWKWTGNGGAHNVVSEKDKFKSGAPVAKAGTTFSHTFKKDGINNYYCNPHKPMGMKGSVAVGKVPHKSAAAAKKVEPHEMGVPLQAHYVGIAAVLMMTTSLVFTFYTLKYGESAHAKGGNN